ncbi:MAG: undecaprenyl-diphosphatase UppP, partial [Anaerolineae bacterium]|nr:undecaprenyl-diphosphatase UppP [Anaerolineae bacterium]
MSLLQAVVLGLLQGVTEFVPISSSAHLVLVPWLFGWPSPGLAFDTVLHLGTLAAVLAVFWRDIVALARAWVASLRRRSAATPQSRLAWALLVGTFPAVLLGVLAEDYVGGLFDAPGPVAALLVVTGLLLVASERWARRSRALEEIGTHHAALIGVFQALAIAPGISRSGATISAGRFLGLPRAEAARFSFLLAIPVIAGAGAMQVARLADAGTLDESLLPLLAGFVAALVSGYLVIRGLLSYLQRRN